MLRAMRVAAQRKHRRMLQQQQRIADQVLLPRSNHLLLDRKRLRVGNTAEMEQMNIAFCIKEEEARDRRGPRLKVQRTRR